MFNSASKYKDLNCASMPSLRRPFALQCSINDIIVNWKKVEALLSSRGPLSGTRSEKQSKPLGVCMHIIGRVFSENGGFNNASGEH